MSTQHVKYIALLLNYTGAKLVNKWLQITERISMTTNEGGALVTFQQQRANQNSIGLA